MTAVFWAGKGNNGQFAGTGDWSDANNWIPAQVPVPGDLAIDQGGSIVATNVGIVGETVWLNSPGPNPPVYLSMQGSSFGPTSTLITNSGVVGVGVGVELHNSALEGTVFVGSGRAGFWVDQNSSAVNTGWIGVASTTSQTSLTIGAVYTAGFGNAGIIETGLHSSTTIGIGSNSIWNTGYMTADPGGDMIVSSDGETTQNTAFTGTLLNLGHITANGGTVSLNSNVLQAAGGSIDVTNNGTLTLEGEVDGGTIQIQSGMLDFGGTTYGPGQYASGHLGAALDFTGPSATLDFNGETVSGMTFDATNNRLYVEFPYGGGMAGQGYFQLSGSYTADNFHVANNEIVYTAGHT